MGYAVAAPQPSSTAGNAGASGTAPKWPLHVRLARAWEQRGETPAPRRINGGVPGLCLLDLGNSLWANLRSSLLRNLGGQRRWRPYLRAMATTLTRSTKMHDTAWAAVELGVNERTVRRYVCAGVLECAVLPGGHYRFTADHIRQCSERALELKHHPRKRTNEAAAEKPARNQRKSRRRRPALGLEPPATPLDLSPDALAALREQYAAAA